MFRKCEATTQAQAIIYTLLDFRWHGRRLAQMKGSENNSINNREA